MYVNVVEVVGMAVTVKVPLPAQGVGCRTQEFRASCGAYSVNRDVFANGQAGRIRRRVDCYSCSAFSCRRNVDGLRHFLLSQRPSLRTAV